MGYFFVNFTKNLCNYPEIAAVSGENENFLGSLQIIHFLIFQHSHVSIFSMLVHFFVQLSLKQTVARAPRWLRLAAWVWEEAILINQNTNSFCKGVKKRH